MAGNFVEGSKTNTIIFILPHKIQKKRFEILRENARKVGLPVVDQFSNIVTHLVTEYSTADQALNATRKPNVEDVIESFSVNVVKTGWLSACIKEKCVIPLSSEHYVHQQKPMINKETEVELVPEYACQRSALLEHHNEKITSALEVLQKYAELKDNELNRSRALAFSRAAATLKSLSRPVRRITDIRNLPDIGEHCIGVIQEILERGFSTEVESILSDEWYRKMKLFTSVFGVGPATAKKWIGAGLTDISDILESGYSKSDDLRISTGLRYFNDLQTKVTRLEAEALREFILLQLQSIKKDATVELAGGFRRGKQSGHDIDLLISHPIEGEEVGILPALLNQLEQQQLIIYGRLERSSYQTDQSHDLSLHGRGGVDGFEKWLGILKIDQKLSEDCCEHRSLENVSGPEAILKSDIFKCPSDNTTCDIDDLSCLSPKKRKILINEDIVENCKQSATVSNEVEVLFNNCYDSQVAPAACERSWLARRVDLIVIPVSQYPYGLVGWTGNRHFNRSMRLYAQKVLNMRLTSHGLFDIVKKISIPASSERQVFDNVKLTYREPHERNC